MTGAERAASEGAWTEWRERREAQLRAPRGNLALVKTEWAADGDAPDLAVLAAEFPPPLAVTPLQRVGFEGEVEHGYRVWDPDGATRRGFDHVATFPYDSAWVVEATFVPVAADRQLPFLHRLDGESPRGHAVPGDILATIAGAEYRLSAFVDGDHLLLVFVDGTNRSDDPGVRTYGAGRFLLLDVPIDGERHPVTLDFNRAIVPPCGFSDEFNCPLAPPGNRFPFEVRAGERLPVFAPDLAVIKDG